MRTAFRTLIVVAGLLIYWLYAPLVPVGAQHILLDECYSAACMIGGDAVQLLGFVAIGVLYSLLLWRALRFFPTRL